MRQVELIISCASAGNPAGRAAPHYFGVMSGIFTDVAVLRIDADDDEQPPGQHKVPLTAISPEGHVRGGIVVLHESRELPDSLLEVSTRTASVSSDSTTPELRR